MCVCTCEYVWHMHGHTPWKVRGHHQVFAIRYYLPQYRRLTSLPRLTGQPAPSLQDFCILSLELHTCATKAWLLTWMLGNRAQIPVLVWQVLY